MGSKSHFLTKYCLHKHLILLFLFSKMANWFSGKWWDNNHSVIVVLACAGHTAKDIVKLTKLPKATVYRVFKWFKEESKVNRKENKTPSDFNRTPKFLSGLECLIEANPSTSMSTIAKKCNVSFFIGSKAVNRYLGMTCNVQRWPSPTNGQGQHHQSREMPKASVIHQASRCRKSLCGWERVQCGHWDE